ncbi:hypothetical protein DWY73_01375 [Bacteroides fragilis]|uniref:Uncharacterized protein n=1 Tax=Bacteroides fragilis TaxID=817 RepID=A0A5C6LAE6_BACFG|nr:hypothetical protein HMPREF0101_01584 [Bacteroides fragilis]RGJ20123.1 hypothetical protein DXD74_02835 [Bacteroides fragilis]RGL74217.1 hypothetical protein DXC49_13005 [Bacteroides fragilis]RGQ96313.1 hypothetical protein DWY73_01375 [Bacteroides fragilis]RHI22484.1 hypothetical protein DW176_00515 [Bacteroides fragilis]
MLSKCGYAYLSLLTEPIETPRTGKYEFAQRLFLLLIIYFIKKECLSNGERHSFLYTT